MSDKSKKKTLGLGIGQALIALLAITAFGLALACWFKIPQDEEDRMFALWDNSTQSLPAAGVWTDIVFRHKIRLEDRHRDRDRRRVLHEGMDVEREDDDDDWRRDRTTFTKVIAKHDDVFSFTLSVQAGLVTPPTVAPTTSPTAAPTILTKKRGMQEMAQTEAPTLIPTACVGSIYYIRAIRRDNRDRDDGFVEIPGSLTFASHDVFASKTFAVHARAGDVFRFQFLSSCAYLVLTPVPLNNPLIGALHHDDDDDDDAVSAITYPSSATLVIS
jgi:hypothetical protein